MQPMSASLFADLVLSKPYFDNAGLIVALDDGQAVGFVHAGFGPNEDQSGLSTQWGVTSMLMVRPDHRRLGIGTELLARSEAYLRSRGAQVLYGGEIRPLIPFYLGLYGGSEMPGVLDSDADAQRRYRAAGYQAIDRVVILQRELGGFRPLVNRQQIQLRRQMSITAVPDPPSRSWWDACTYGQFNRERFDLSARSGGPVLATATAWFMEPLSMSWGVRSAGLVDLDVVASHRHQGLATFLLGETFQRLRDDGYALVEVQTMSQNEAARALYAKLGFNQIDQGVVFRK